MSDNLTREALQQELWNMLPDSCKKIMDCLKETYLESLLADIDSYCQGQKQVPIWVKASERLPGNPSASADDQVVVKWLASGCRRVDLITPHALKDWEKNNPSIEFEWLDEAAQVIASNEIITALQKFVSRHEAGLLPDRFVYEQAKTALEGNQGDLGEMEYRGPNSHCKACEDEAAGIKHITAQKHTCRKRRAKQ